MTYTRTKLPHVYLLLFWLPIFLIGSTSFPSYSQSFQQEINQLDTTIIRLCAGDSAVLDGDIFYPGEEVLLSTVNGGGTFIQIQELPLPVVNTQVSPLNCKNNTADIEIVSLQSKTTLDIQWSTGETSDNLLGVSPGKYYAKVTDQNGCSITVEAIVTDQLPQITAQVEKVNVSCEGKKDGAISINQIQGGNFPYQFSMDNKRYQNTNIFDRLGSGLYDIYVKDRNECITRFTANIETPEPIGVRLPQMTNVILGDTVYLNPQVDENKKLQFFWSPKDGLSCTACKNPYFIATTDRSYTVATRNEVGCIAYNTINFIIDKNRSVFIPNAFSPNDDAINDTFGLFDRNNIYRIRQVRIFNRWGELILEDMGIPARDSEKIWNGQVNNVGSEAPSGSYMYFMEVEFLDGIIDIYKGEVTLIRQMNK